MCIRDSRSFSPGNFSAGSVPHIKIYLPSLHDEKYIAFRGVCHGEFRGAQGGKGPKVSGTGDPAKCKDIVSLINDKIILKIFSKLVYCR